MHFEQPRINQRFRRGRRLNDILGLSFGEGALAQAGATLGETAQAKV